MNSKLKTIGWRKFKNGQARHHWRTRNHMTYYFSACGMTMRKRELETDDTLPACEHCEISLDLYGIEDPAPPQI